MIEVVDPPEIFGHTIFCDEIRLEATGKFIYIGVYQSAIQVHAPFPIKLPRMAFAIAVMQRTQVFVPKIGYRIFLPGDADEAPSIEAEIGEAVPGSMLQQADVNAAAANVPEVSREWVTLNSNLSFESFEIKQPGTLKVRADIGGKRYRLGSIQIVSGPPAQQS